MGTGDTTCDVDAHHGGETPGPVGGCFIPGFAA
jgi:hypothetical protein